MPNGEHGRFHRSRIIVDLTERSRLFQFGGCDCKFLAKVDILLLEVNC